MNIKAFTMAEVLITLGIIGIVAAMTIPMMQNKYKKTLIETRLASTESILNQALSMSIAKNGPVSGWEFSMNTTDFFNKYYAPYLKYTHICEWNEQESSWTECSTKKLLRQCSSMAVTESGEKVNINNNQRKYLLNNGVAITLVSGKSSFVLDLNISKSQLKYGRDYFRITANKYFEGMPKDESYMSSLTYVRGGYTSSTGNYQRSACDLIKNNKNTSDGKTFYEHCRTGHGNWFYGDCCSAIIKCNGGRIPKDYPIRL